MEPLRFVFVTDTHIGCDNNGYQLQNRYVGRENELFAGLGKWARQQGAQLVIHGGDLTDHGTREEIDRAGELTGRLGLPMALCLGNHDLAQRDSIDHWRAAKHNWLPDGQDCFSLSYPQATMIIANHHWHPDASFYWNKNKKMEPRLDRKQIARLDQLMSQAPGPIIAITHAPLNEVDAKQRHSDQPFHPPYEPFVQTWRELAGRHPNLKLIFGGHNHAHSDFDHGRFVSTTTAAFNERPAQVRLITVDDKHIRVETFNLAKLLGLSDELNVEKAWSVGPAPLTSELRRAASHNNNCLNVCTASA